MLDILPIKQIRKLQIQQIQQQINLLHNAASDKTCYILTCGPSLQKVWTDEMKDLLKDKFVITVKQASRLAGDISDIHIANEHNAESYSVNQNTLKISTLSKDIKNNYNADICFIPKYFNYRFQIFKDRKVENHALSKTLIRPFPGMMTEIGMYLPEHLGCTKTIIIGWDLNPHDLRHFYSNDKVHEVEEYKKIIDLSPRIVEWYESVGKEIYLYSPLSALKIPQISEEEFYKEHRTMYNTNSDRFFNNPIHNKGVVMSSIEIKTKSVTQIEKSKVKVIFSITNSGDAISTSEKHSLHFRPHDNLKNIAGQVMDINRIDKGQTIEVEQICPIDKIGDARFGLVIEGKKWLVKGVEIDGEIIPLPKPKEKVVIKTQEEQEEGKSVHSSPKKGSKRKRKKRKYTRKSNES